MEKVVVDLIPFLIPAMIAGIGWLWKKFLSMSERLAILENDVNTCKKDIDEDLGMLKEKINSERDQIHKTIEKIQQRQDSHSRKQDDTQKMITELDVKMVTKFGDIAKELSSIASDVRNINRVFQIYDDKILLREKK